MIPGDSSNTIRLNRNIEVAVLSTATFDARSINVTTLRFGKVGNENSLVRNSSGQPSYSYRDVNGDGRLDLVVLVDAGDTGLEASDTFARLTGSLDDGQSLTGSSSVTVRRSKGACAFRGSRQRKTTPTAIVASVAARIGCAK